VIKKNFPLNPCILNILPIKKKRKQQQQKKILKMIKNFKFDENIYIKKKKKKKKKKRNYR